MKSQIKVDYKSRYGEGSFGDKEPLIRIDFIPSDDPRDTLLGEIFQDRDFCQIGGIRRNPGQVTGIQQFVVFRKSNRERKINEILSPIFLALTKYSGIDANFITSHNEMYFELCTNYKIRSKGVGKHNPDNKYPMPIEEEEDNKFIQMVVDDWKDFEKIVENSKINLEKEK